MILWNSPKLNPACQSNDAPLFPLSYFYKLAEKCINKFGGQVRRSMLKDHDAISFVTTYLIFSQVNYQPDKGRTLKSYLNQYAIYAIKKWKYKKLQEKQGRFKRLQENYIQRRTSPVEQLIHAEELQALRANINELHDNQCIFLLDYLDGYSMTEISSRYNTTIQNVSQTIKHGINKIKQRYKKGNGRRTISTRPSG